MVFQEPVVEGGSLGVFVDSNGNSDDEVEVEVEVEAEVEVEVEVVEGTIEVSGNEDEVPSETRFGGAVEGG